MSRPDSDGNITLVTSGYTYVTDGYEQDNWLQFSILYHHL